MSSTDYITFHSDLPPLSKHIPETYARLYLDPKSIPSTKIVGVLACQRDPYLRELETEVVAIRKHQKEETAKPNSKKAKKGSQPEGEVKGQNDVQVTGGEQLYEVELKDTVLFPEGGGQPFDTGYLIPVIADSPSASSDTFTSFKVINVFRRGLTAVHLVSAPGRDDDSESIEKLLGEGAKVRAVVDWERRVDHMTQHTAQHLLSALCDIHLQLPTLSWFLPPHPSLEPCYIELPRSLTIDEAKRMETFGNELVTLGWRSKREDEDVAVWIESKVQKHGSDSASASGIQTPVGNGAGDEQKETDGLGLRLNGRAVDKKPDINGVDEKEWGDRESRGLPKDYSGGVIRTAVIDGIDRSLCCGTHHPSLHRCEVMHVIPPGASLASNKPTRLYMVAGPRAHKHLIAASETLSQAASTLTCPRTEVGFRVEQREQARNVAARERTGLRSELAKLLGTSIQWQAGETPTSVKRALVSRSEEGTHDFDFMGQVNSIALTALIEEAAGDTKDQNNAQDIPEPPPNALTTNGSGGKSGKAKKALVATGPDPSPYLLVVTSSLPTNTARLCPSADAEMTLIQITSFPQDLAKNVGDALKSNFETAEAGSGSRVKGGGAKGRWMGKVSGKWGKREQQALESAMKV